MFADEVISSVLISMQTNLLEAAKRLIQIANDNGIHDNVSVILVIINSDFTAPLGRLKSYRCGLISGNRSKADKARISFSERS